MAERFYCESKSARTVSLPADLDIQHQLLSCHGSQQLGKFSTEYERGLRRQVAQAKCQIPEATLLAAPDAASLLVSARQALRQGQDLRTHLGAGYANMGSALETCQKGGLYQASAALQLHPDFRGGTLKLAPEGAGDGEHVRAQGGTEEAGLR
jgi:hypothetical protein